MTERKVVDLDAEFKSLSLNRFNSVSDKGSELILSVDHLLFVLLCTEDKRTELIIQYKQALSILLEYSSSDEFAEKVCVVPVVNHIVILIIFS